MKRNRITTNYTYLAHFNQIIIKKKDCSPTCLQPGQTEERRSDPRRPERVFWREGSPESGTVPV